MSFRAAFTKTEFLVVASILLMLAALLFLGESPPPVVPSEPPNERNRNFCHTDNSHFSIICPERWSTSNELEIWSRSATDVASSSYPLGRIYARGTPFVPKEESEIKRLPTMDFQGSIAHYETEIIPSRKMLGPSGYFFALYFERDGKFYQLSYVVNQKMKEFPPPIILEYFNTFRVENEDENEH